MLSDADIRAAISAGTIGITSWDSRSEVQLQPASYDLQLGDRLQLQYPDSAESRFVIPYESASGDFWYERSMRLEPTTIPDGDQVPGYWLRPGEFILGHTDEEIRLGSTVAAQVNGKSTLGRWGLLVHMTAGFIDPGFDGQITLELLNVSRKLILLRPGMLIAQVGFFALSSMVEKDYQDKGGKYTGGSATGAVGGR